MSHAMDRRHFLGTATAGLLGTGLFSDTLLAEAAPISADGLKLARFRFDVTPPMGHSCCGGWIKPVEAVDDELEAIGLVLLGAGKPIVVCVVDWTGLLNSAHFAFREALAKAAGTSVERVTAHCVHQHDAPMACLDAQRIVDQYEELPDIVDVEFFNRCLEAAGKAVGEALPNAVPVTHVAHGEGKVEKVAGNRRIIGPDGKIASQRGSASRNPEHHRLPEGVIDPMLKTVAFFNGDKKIASCHYYACHPMSYYGQGRVSSDFCGLARKRRQAEEPECFHLYFNGCGGNIGAGKYNDGSPAMRPVLTQRIYDGIVASEANLKPEPIESVKWVTEDILPPPNPVFDEEALLKQIADPNQSVVNRNRPAYTVAWLQRSRKKIPITLSALHLNNVSMVHFPSESFVEYQLEAQKAAPDRFVACAAYGDGGPWYIPTEEAYPQGGYAVSVAWCGPQIDPILTKAVETMLGHAEKS